MAFCCDVTDLAHEAVRQLLLDEKIPVCVVEIAAVTSDCFGGQALGLSLPQKPGNRVRKAGHVISSKRKPASRAFVGVTEIVVLSRPIVNAEPSANHRSPLKALRRPGETDPRDKV